jgi:peptidoglycan/xylan/chitin deacetylase (PgdA/CDA1 family)
MSARTVRDTDTSLVFNSVAVAEHDVGVERIGGSFGGGETRCIAFVAGTTSAQRWCSYATWDRVEPSTETPTQLGVIDKVENNPAASFTVVQNVGPGQVALTFDDGPHPATTSAVLAILAEKQVGATFFFVGSGVSRNDHAKSLVRSVHDAGHSVQNHTWGHPFLSRESVDTVRQELVRTSEVIREVTGEAPTLFRPPYGATNAAVVEVAQRQGLGQVLWGAAPSSMEASGETMVGEITAQARRAMEQNRGLVVLLHDGSGNRSGTVSALPELIDVLRTAGWEFVVLR